MPSQKCWANNPLGVNCLVTKRESFTRSMSVRHVDEYESHDAVQQFRADIASVRSTEEAPDFAALSEPEKSAALIGVAPDAWKPISWLNQGHYGELLRKNALGGRLTQQIEAFKHVSGQ